MIWRTSFRERSTVVLNKSVIPLPLYVEKFSEDPYLGQLLVEIML